MDGVKGGGRFKWFVLVTMILAAGLYAFGISSLLEKKRVGERMRAEGYLVLAVAETADLIHEIQIERGLSVAFLSGKGREFRSLLSRQKGASDLRFKEVNRHLGSEHFSLLASGDTSFIEGVVSRHGEVDAFRAKVLDRAVSPADAAGFYTGLNAELLNGFKRISESIADRASFVRMLNYLVFAEYKERVARERYLLAEVLASGNFPPTRRNQLTALTARQEVYSDTFSYHASPDVIREYKKIKAHEAFQAVVRLRNRLLAGPLEEGGDVTPLQWWRASTDKIDLLRDMETFLLSDVRGRAGLAEADAEREYDFNLLFILVMTGILFPLIFREAWALGNELRHGNRRDRRVEWGSRSSAKKRGDRLIRTMFLTVVAVLLISLFQIGWAVYSGQKKGLTEKLVVQKEVIEAVGRFDAGFSRADHQAGNVAATLSQVLDAKSRAIRQYHGSAEFTLAEKRGETFVFLLLPDVKAAKVETLNSDIYRLGITEYALPASGRTAAPMRLALSGRTGTVTGMDYRGVWVLAAHTPLQIGNKRFGLVAKIDMAEVFLPMVKMGLATLVLAGVLILTGAGRFMGLVNPLIESLEKEVAANRAMIEASPCGIFTLRRDGRILAFNRTAEQMFGYVAREIIGLMVQAVLPEYTFGAVGRLSGEDAGGVAGDAVAGELPGLRKDGSTFPLHVNTGRMTVGGECQFVVMVSDMTELKIKEEEIRRHKDHLEELVTIATAEIKAIVQTAVSGIITIDEEGVVHIFNPSAEALFGWAPKEVLGKNITMLMEDSVAARLPGYLKQYLKTGKASIIGTGREITAKRRDGSLFPAHLAVGHAKLANGGHYFVGFVTDITDQKAREAELKLAKETAEAGARSKAAFIANMSHEIRTPMNAVLGFTEVALKDTGMARETRGYLRTILGSARALLGIINDILDVSKMESGKFGLETICFNLPNTLAEAVKTIGSKASEKGLEISLDYDRKLGPLFLGDPTRLRQVILNLVGNAVKFTEKGGVEISVRKDSAPDMLHFSVRDTGIGMPPEQAGKIFQPFVQADESTTRKFGGTGLGTTISRQIVEIMGGRIWVESREGEGSVFHFTALLPVAALGAICLHTDQPEMNEEYVSPRRFRVLLAEDVQANADLALLRLREQGHAAELAMNGIEAVNAFKEDDFDLILMDVMMPELDGLEATRRIRTLEAELGGRIPILALTASVMQEEYNSCMGAGMDGVLAKPIDFDKLFSEMEDVVPKGRGTPNRPLSSGKALGETVDFSPLDRVADHVGSLETWRNPGAYARALVDFAKKHGDDAIGIKASILGQEKDEAGKAIHTLKGLAGNLGLYRVAGIANEMEKALKEGGLETGEGPGNALEEALGEAVAAVGRLDYPVGKPDRGPVKTFDGREVSRLLGKLVGELEQLDPDTAEPLIEALGDYLPVEDVTSVGGMLADFDFDGAASAARALVHKYQLEWEAE